MFKFKLAPLFALLLSLASLPASAFEKTVALKYTEEGNWIVHVVSLDPEGYPDTLEKRAYATEAQADSRIAKLNLPVGGTEKSLVDEPTHELRNVLAGEIWAATESWSVDWENRFADWIRANFDRKFFKRYKIATDCADATVALRWIYARIHGLPAGNRLDWGGGLMTNRSVRAEWKNLPTAANWYDDRRFRAALDYILDNTYTHSVNADSYPVEINDQWIKEGTFHLELRESDGHTRIFTDVTRKRLAWPIQEMWSTVPRKVRALVRDPFTVFVQPPLRRGGIVRHRWVRLSPEGAVLVPAESMPGFSLEQYRPDFFKHGGTDFSVEVASRLRESLDPVIGLRAVLDNLKDAISERIDVVRDGYKLCAREDCAPGTKNYEDWSTPSRDARIGQYFDQVRGYLDTLHGSDLDRAKAYVEKAQRKTWLKLEGVKLGYESVETIWRANRFSSDPRDPPVKRWGIDP